MAMSTEVRWSNRNHVLLLIVHGRRSASYYNPLQWIQEKFAPRPRKADPVGEKKSEQEKQGQQSVFEAAVSHEKRPKAKSTETAPTVVKKKATEV
jgi:large subunit ribosomal protein L22